jgi:uncharacterized membrane protein HdeD (DUF308 family)
MSAASTPLATIGRKSLGWSIALSILLILAGVAAILIPPAAGIAVTVFMGWVLVFSGAIHLVYAWHTGDAGGIIWEVFISIVYISTGGYLLWNPVLGLVALTFALAVYLFLEAILEFVLSFQLRPASGRGWLLFDGVITLILAFLIWRTWPSGAPWVLGTIVGISMLFSGTARLMLSLAARRLLRRTA